MPAQESSTFSQTMISSWGSSAPAVVSVMVSDIASLGSTRSNF
jgi:hypothetical protein